MDTFFSSDLHFGHSRNFIFGPRGFDSIEDHDATIIERWNELVRPDDECYLLGDLMLGANHEYGLNCLRQLNGYKYLVTGNHDTARRCQEYAELPRTTILGYADVVKVAGHKFFICHYKTETSCLENMTPIKNHLINLHGHTHSPHKFEDNKPYQYNVALDAHNCYPVNVETIISDIHTEVQNCLSYL